jgi:hypothetical protein
MTTLSRPIAVAALTGLLATTLTSAAAAATSADPATRAAAVRGFLLPANQSQAEAIDISPAGVVVGTLATAQGAPTAAQRWAPRAGGGWARRSLSVPDAAPSRVSGVTNRGEAGGYIGTGTSATAHRWTATGRRAIPLVPAQSATSAVGPNQWLVNLGDSLFASQTAIIARDGTSTPITAIPGRAVAGMSIAGPQTAVVSSTDGVGPNTTGTPYVWESGAAQALPVFSSFTFGTACVSAVQADGSVAYSGAARQDGTPTVGQRIGVLRGGVNGQDTPLQTPAGAFAVSLGFQCPHRDDVLSSDGWAVGSVTWVGAPPEAVIWRPDGTAVLPGLHEGEHSSVAAAVATGGRAVLRVSTDQGDRLYYWRDGVRTPLTLPTNWSLLDIVEITETGYILANLQGGGGDVPQTRPAVWRVPTSWRQARP